MPDHIGTRISMAPSAIIVDYSLTYYEDIAKTGLPAVRSGKFVRLSRGDSEYLVLSPRELSPYHADILERFCRERAIEGSYAEGKKRFDIRDAEWTIRGGGKFEIDRTNRYVRFYDNSMAYGRFETRGLRELVVQNEIFRDYEVRIE